ncbi:MAG: type II secretion system F family protein, partial [Acetobacteraceae bacterium]
MLNQRVLSAVAFGSLLLLLVGSIALLRSLGMQRRVRRRIDHARGVPAEERAISVDQVSALPMAMLTAFGRLVATSGLLPARTLNELERTLAAAGFRGASGLWMFLGAKIALFVGLPVVALVMMADGGASPMKRLTIAGVAAAGGLLAPDWIIGRMRKRYVARLERGLPDALDLLVICAQAGLGLEAAIERVAEEIRPAHRDIGHELELTAHELQIVADSRVALAALGQRTGLDSLKRLTGTLLQSLQYGT